MVKKILIVKTTSLGDVVHMLPAISDAVSEYPDIMFDWVVEAPFAEVPKWHPQIKRVIPIQIRQWRKRLFQRQTWKEISEAYQSIRLEKYDHVVDSQGLLKSALVTRLCDGRRSGYAKNSIKEPIASYFYENKVTVSMDEHAITRNRQLLAKVLGYKIEDKVLDYGISNMPIGDSLGDPLKKLVPKRYVVALHGTSREDKEWPIEVWDRFLSASQLKGYGFIFPWGNEREYKRALALKETHDSVIVLPRCSLSQLAMLIQSASAVIGMDTGLMHIAAALGQKGVALYPVTQPELTGVRENGDTNHIQSLGGKSSLDVDQVITRMSTHLSLFQ